MRRSAPSIGAAPWRFPPPRAPACRRATPAPAVAAAVRPAARFRGSDAATSCHGGAELAVALTGRGVHRRGAPSFSMQAEGVRRNSARPPPERRFRPQARGDVGGLVPARSPPASEGGRPPALRHARLFRRTAGSGLPVPGGSRAHHQVGTTPADAARRTATRTHGLSEPSGPSLGPAAGQCQAAPIARASANGSQHHRGFGAAVGIDPCRAGLAPLVSDQAGAALHVPRRYSSGLTHIRGGWP